MGLPDNHCVADITIPQPDPYKISQNYNHGLGILMYQFQQHAVYKITQKFKHHYGTLDNRRTICLSAQSIVHLTAQIQNMETRVANFFWGCTGPYFGPTNTINTKNYQKNTTGSKFWSIFIKWVEFPWRWRWQSVWPSQWVLKSTTQVGVSQHIWETPKKIGAKKSMLNFSRWTRTFVPYEKWDSPKVQKMTHNAKFDHQGGQYGRPKVQTC